MLFNLLIPFLLSTFAYGFVAERPFDVLRGLMKLENAEINSEDFNALNDLEGNSQEDRISYGRVVKNNAEKVQVRKKMDFKPKYDPGWKFIGLGKRPRHNEIVYAYENPYSTISPNDSGYFREDYYQHKDTKVNPLLAISSIINFEIFNAIRDGIAEAANDLKKEDSKHFQDYSGVNSGNARFTGRSSYVGRQGGMYDPGWMLTGLGK